MDSESNDDAVIRARFGRVPVSAVAAYAGPEAAAQDWSLVEQIAGTVIERQPRTGDIPPPPPGPPGFPDGKEQPVAAATNEVLRLPLPGMDSDVVVLTGDGCTVVSLDGLRPQTGWCQSDAHTQAGDHVDAETLLVGDVVRPPPPPGQGQTSAMFVAMQVGERVERVEARLVDGRRIEGEVSDGWALMVAEGRIAWLTGHDADGSELATVFVR
ncbi:MAG: hypothetical protein WD080_11560 [Egibacteraceae bacterium]